MSAQIKDGGVVDVLALLRDFARNCEEHHEAEAGQVLAAITELVEINQRVVHHLANAVEFIEKQYPDARQLDRAPIMRNMRRWRDQLTAALARVGGAS